MPRFLTLVRIDERNAPAESPDPGFEGRMATLFEEITKAGVMLDTAGLTPTSQGTRITWSDGTLHRTDGPNTEDRDVIGGYALTRCKDKAEALKWTERFLRIHPEHWTVTAEVREIAEN